MALKLYVLMMDVSDPSSLIDRYIVENSPAWSVADGWGTNPYVGATNAAWATPASRQVSIADAGLTEQQRRDLSYADTQWTELLGRYRSASYTGPEKFAASFYGEVSAGQRVPARVKAFLDAKPSKVNAFSHYADRELAAFWARKAASRSLAQISAMGGHDGIRAVGEMWDCVGNYFRAINVRPWSWAKFRNSLKVNVGTYSSPSDPDAGTSSSTHQHRLHLSNWGTPGFLPGNAGAAAGRFTNLPENRGYLYQYEPSPVADKYPGRWRISAARLMSQRYGRAISPQHLRFGAINDYAGDSNGNGAGGVERAATQSTCPSVDSVPPKAYSFVTWEGCEHPSGDAHPLWAKNNGLVTDLFGSLITNDGVDPARAVMRSNQTDYQNIIRRPWAVDDYSDAITDNRQDLIPIPPTGTSQWSWLSDAMMTGDWNVYLPPYLWYAKLLWPLVEYLQTKDPLELIHEVKMDVIGRNLWQNAASGNSVPDIGSDGESLAATIVDAVFGIATGIVGAINPIAGALVGAAGAVTSELMKELADKDAVLIDCFGRRFGEFRSGGKSGIIDAFMICPMYRKEQLPTVADDLYFGMGGQRPVANGDISYSLPIDGFVDTPMPIAFRRPVFNLRGMTEAWALSGSLPSLAAMPDYVYDPSATPLDSRLVIVGLPRDARVEIDGDDAQFGRWDDAARTRWSSPESNGDHRLKVTLPNGRSYSQTVFVPANRPAVVLYDVLSGKVQAVELQKREESKIPWPAIVIGGAAIVAAIYIVTKKDYPTTKNPRSRTKLPRRSR